jgi:hypothetical protein
MADPRPTTPTPHLDEASRQEALAHETGLASGQPREDVRRQLLEALGSDGVLRTDELLKRLARESPPEDWKARLWRLHNEGVVKVRWVGLADPEPVEVRITERGKALLAEPEGEPSIHAAAPASPA